MGHADVGFNSRRVCGQVAAAFVYLLGSIRRRSAASPSDRRVRIHIYIRDRSLVMDA